MKERPILFSGEMVRAILEGRKTQTRRVMKEPWRVRLTRNVHGDGPWRSTKAEAGIHVAEHNPFGAVSVRSAGGALLGVKPDEFEWVCPYGQAGDRLWVRETYAELCLPDELDGEVEVAYRADEWPEGDIGPDLNGRGWRPSIFMPRWASRITLEVVAVRVERVQAISEADAAAEGVVPSIEHFDGDTINMSARDNFRFLWDSINGARGHGWPTNPWVWVVEFKRVQP